VLLAMKLLLNRAPYIRTVLASERGQGMVEYALILFLISIAAILVLPAIGVHVTDVFTAVNDALQDTPGT